MLQKPADGPAVEIRTVPRGHGPLLLVHAGAGGHVRGQDLGACEEGLRGALAAGTARLTGGQSALDAVCAAVAELEDVDQFNSGRGAALDSDGRAELDACVMTGDRRAGAVCGTRFARHPVIAARRVMEATPHVLLAGPSRETLEELGVECVDPSYFVTELRREQLRRTCAGEEEFAKHGTVGAVAIDSAGHIAVATSTGGIVGQMAGRVGDSPLVGAGTYADERSVAVSCTGYGEMFVRAVTAHSLHARILIGGESLEHAARAVLDDVAALGGDGGLISATPDGTGVIAYNSPQMFYAYERGNEQVVHV